MSDISVEQTGNRWEWKLWGQWVLANMLGEIIGLGATLLIGVFLLFLQEARVIGVILAMALSAIAGAFIEGTVVGTAQWLVLRRILQQMRWLAWALMTALGAGVAWTLGMIPSIILSGGPESGTAPPAEPNQLVIYVLAAAMGIVLGTVLGAAQWLELRRHVPAAGWWIAANALAWMAGMVTIFIGTSFLSVEGLTLFVALLQVLFTLIAGVLVGAIHGLVLVRLLRPLHMRRLQPAA